MKSELFKNICAGIFYLTLSWVIFDMSYFIKNKVSNEISLIKNETFSYLYQTTDKIDNRISSVENRLFKRISSIENNTFKRIDSIEQKTFVSVKNIENELMLLSNEYKTIPKNSEKIFARFDTQTNCNINDYCWQNLTSDLLIDTRNTVRETSKTFQVEIPKITKNIGSMTNTFDQKFPVIVDNTTKITDNAQKFTENMDRLTKPKWYDRMIGWGVNSSIIYFNLRRFR